MNPVGLAAGSLLWSRAAVLSGVALLVGAVAHVQAGGLLPGPGVLAALLGCGTLLAAPFLRRPGSTPLIVSLLVAGQAVVHVVLSATAGHRGDPAAHTAAPGTSPVTSPVPMPVPGHGARRGSYYDVAYASVVGDQGSGPAVPDPLLHAVTDAAAHPGMAVAHLLAAVVCGWWLARGERALWQVLALTAQGWSRAAALPLRAWRAWAAVATAATLAVSHELGRISTALHDVSCPRLPELARSVCRRGPPQLA